MKTSEMQSDGFVDQRTERALGDSSGLGEKLGVCFSGSECQALAYHARKVMHRVQRVQGKSLRDLSLSYKVCKIPNDCGEFGSGKNMDRKRKTPTDQVTVRLTEEVAALLAEAVEETKRTQSSIINECIESALPHIVGGTAERSARLAEKLEARSIAKPARIARS